jgi:hypothetical protein
MTREAIRYSNVVSQLLAKVPDFAARPRHWDADLPHEVLGSFALFLCEEVHRGANESTLDRAFEFVNELASSNDDDVKNLLVVSVLEVLADDEKCRTAALDHFSDESRVLLERVLSGWSR